MFSLEEKKLIADYLDIKYDYTKCDHCGMYNPETFKYSRLTKCCSAKEIGKNEQGDSIWDKPKNFFYTVPSQNDGCKYASIGKETSMGCLKAEDLFFSNWDYLMKLVHCIEAEGRCVFIVNNFCSIKKNKVMSSETITTRDLGSKIESVSRAIIDYLIWLKSNTKTEHSI